MRLSTFLPVAPIAAGAPLAACTGFCLSNGREVLFGNNEDYHNPLTKVCFVPGGDGTFGRVYVGFGEDDAFPQMMAECETVEQVIGLFGRHSRAFMHRFVITVADASGDSVA